MPSLIWLSNQFILLNKKGHILKKLLLIFCAVFAYADFGVYFDRINSKDADILELFNPFFISDLDAKLHLQAILNDKVKINEQWYQKDDSINGAIIIEISPSQGFVLFEKNKQHFHLNLKRANHKIHIR